MAELKAVKKRSAVDDVYDQMADMIKNKSWTLGSQLPSENELARQMSVSRFTVRSAISRFVALGIMETRNGEGTFIKSSMTENAADPLTSAINISSLIELLQLRRGIEMVAARLAAENRTPEQLAELEGILLRMETCQQRNDIERYIEEDVSFHMTIARISGNVAVATVMEMLGESLYDHFAGTAALYGIHTKDIHRNVFDAIKRQDPVLAESITSANLQSIVDKTVARQKKNEERQ